MRRPLARHLPAFGVVAALLGGAAPAAAQSFFAGRGLGLVSDPLSAQSTALGGVGLGLPGGEFSWSNPAGAVGLPAAGLLVSTQVDRFSARVAGRDTDGRTARFPLVIGAFPLGEKWALTAGFGSFLDQRWSVEQLDTLVSGADSSVVLDRFRSDGGVARLRLGAGYRVLPRLSVGLGLDLYTGGVERVAGRIFLAQEVNPRCCTARWEYGGTGALASVDWNPSEALNLSLSGTLGGTLKAEAQDSVATDRSYALPASAAVGASGRVAASTLVAATASWTGWSSLDPALAAEGGARDSWAFGGGLEWDALQIAGRTLPLRLGARYRDLPFRWGNAGTLSDFTGERAFTGGTGLVLGGGATRADLSVERGRRGESGQGLYESFWRVGFSIAVLGQ